MSEARDLSSNALKNIAIAMMFLDHAATLLVPRATVLSVLLHIPGRVVAPIMCYMIAEGFHHTSNLARYAKRLFLFALLSHFPYVWAFGLDWTHTTSVMWGLFLGLMALAAVQSGRIPAWGKVAAVSVCCVLALPADWHMVSVLWIVAFGCFRGQFKQQMIAFVLIGYGFNAIPMVWRNGWPYVYQFAILLAIPLLAMYKGRRGRQSHWMRWGFYIFYPAHLLLLFLLRLVLP